MMSRLKNLPKYSCADTLVDSKQYNAARLALYRLAKVVRFPIKGYEHLEVIIDEDSWVVVDHLQNDLPIVAWTDFQATGRGLHEPVRCQLSYYHFGAAVVANKGLAAINRYLGIKLERESKKAVARSESPTAIDSVVRLKVAGKA
ncbi:MAG: hypothetical protein OEW58_02480 [Gammaproteobacteria bacterium]|nr:hypothetical protein [Gammaproteobacteria bacterium]